MDEKLSPKWSFGVKKSSLYGYVRVSVSVFGQIMSYGHYPLLTFVGSMSRLTCFYVPTNDVVQILSLFFSFHHVWENILENILPALNHTSDVTVPFRGLYIIHLFHLTFRNLRDFRKNYRMYTVVLDLLTYLFIIVNNRTTPSPPSNVLWTWKM